MNQVASRKLAIMFTDMIGYSSMMAADKGQAIIQLECYRAILFPIIEAHHGTASAFGGDSIFAHFESVIDAVSAGIEIQQALHQANEDSKEKLRTRIGVHYGDVTERKDAFCGEDVNIAARLEPLGDAAGICISSIIYDQLDDKLQENCISIGKPRLKNIGRKLEVFHLFALPLNNKKRLQIHLRRFKRYLIDYPAVSLPALVGIPALVTYLFLPLFSNLAPNTYYVELGEFKNLSPEEMPAYYTIGIADEIRTRLKSMPNLYLSSPEDEIGADLLLSGNIQLLQDGVRVSYQVTRRNDGASIAAASIDGKLENMLLLQTRLADKVAVQLADEFELTLEQKKIAKHQVNPEAYQYYLQGREYAGRPDDKQTLNAAIMLYEQALQADDEFATAYAGLCNVLWDMYVLERHVELVKQAEQACLDAENLDKDSADVQVALGKIYNGRGRPQDSIRAFNKAIELEPRNNQAFVGLADVYMTINKPKLAEQTYRRAIGLQPGNWQAWSSYGNYQFNSGQFDQAAQSFRKVIGLTPDSVNAYANLGAVLLYLGDFRQAAKIFDRQARLKSSAAILSNAATMYYYSGEYRHAATLYKQAIELEPQQCLYRVNLGDALGQLENRTEVVRSADKLALELCNDELQVNPENYEILILKSRVLARLGRAEEALETIESYKITEHSDPQVQLNLALLFLRVGDEQAAKNSLEEALQLGYPRMLVEAEPEFVAVKDEPWFRSLLTDL